jgi:hypothetical protein
VQLRALKQQQQLTKITLKLAKRPKTPNKSFHSNLYMTLNFTLLNLQSTHKCQAAGTYNHVDAVLYAHKWETLLLSFPLTNHHCLSLLNPSNCLSVTKRNFLVSKIPLVSFGAFYNTESIALYVPCFMPVQIQVDT